MRYVVVDVEEHYGPLSKRLAHRVQREHPGSTVHELVPLKDIEVEYRVADAGSVPVSDWRRIEDDLVEEVRKLGYPASTRWEDGDKTFVIVAEFRSDEETTAESRAHETWGELGCYSPRSIDMVEVE